MVKVIPAENPSFGLTYSKLVIDKQTELTRKPNEIVRSSEEFRRSESEGSLVRLPAGVKDRANIAGAGINIPQCGLDCGDAGHILLSKRVADDLENYTRW